MKTKKKPDVSKWKTETVSKSKKSARLMGEGINGGKGFWKRYVFSLEWKSERVMDDDSADDEGEEDWLRQGWRSETRSEVMHVGMNGLWFCNQWQFDNLRQNWAWVGYWLQWKMHHEFVFLPPDAMLARY